MLRIINEPTAASLAYGLHERDRGIVAVYDLGGGTFDVSLLRIKDGVFEVLATGGDTHLGGDDFDRAISAHLREEIRKAHGVDPGDAPETLAALTLTAERLKKKLSEEDVAEYEFEIDAAHTHRGSLTRAQMEEILAPIAERTLAPCRQALADAGLAPEEVDEVVLVGGSTRVPLVRRMVEELFRASAPTPTWTPTRWWLWVRRCRRTSSRAGGRTCFCSTLRRFLWASRPWAA